jgi:lysophospholipase L1-like esterase
VAVGLALVYLAWTRSGAAARIGDRNGDGVVTVACLGDSNTLGTNPSRTSWCDLLGGMIKRPDWRTVNRGVAGATAVQGDWPDAYDQLAATLTADKPDVVIFAFGTNDVTWAASYATLVHRTPLPEYLEPSVAALRELYDRAETAGATAFIATTPPANDGIALRAEHTPYFNQRLRDEFPAPRVVDFTSAIDPAVDLHDALHLNESGQAKLAAAAYAALGLDR